MLYKRDAEVNSTPLLLYRTGSSVGGDVQAPCPQGKAGMEVRKWTWSMIPTAVSWQDDLEENFCFTFTE